MAFLIFIIRSQFSFSSSYSVLGGFPVPKFTNATTLKMPLCCLMDILSVKLANAAMFMHLVQSGAKWHRVYESMH